MTSGCTQHNGLRRSSHNATEPPSNEQSDDLYQRYLAVFRQRQAVVEGSSAPPAVRQRYQSLTPLPLEHFEAEIACDTQLGRKILEIIGRHN